MCLCDTMIHITDTLDSQTRVALEDRVRSVEGVIAPRFNPGKNHLLLVAYNKDKTSAKALLDTVCQQGYQAKIVAI